MMDAKNYPEFKTDRLVLRKPQIEDSELLFLIRSEKNSAEVMGVFPDTKLDDTTKFLSKIIPGIDGRNWYYWLIIKEVEIVGSICLWNINEENHSAEFGFQIGEKYQHEGYMSEAFKVVEEHAFSALKFKKLFVYTNTNNSKAKKFIEKMGYQSFEVIEEKNGRDEMVKMIGHFKNR